MGFKTMSASRSWLFAASAFAMAVLGYTPAFAQQAATAARSASATTPQVTFHKDVEPILQRSCQRCHNPNSVAPMSLLTYQQVRPYARAIKQRTQLARAPWARGAMPPWFLEKTVGVQQIKDDNSLSDAELDLIARWVDSGAPEGNAADAPAPLKLVKSGEWALGSPDLVVSSPTVFVAGVASDWSGSWGKSPLANKEDRYARSAEFHEVNSRALNGAKDNGTIAGADIGGGRFVIHHATTSISGPDEAEEEVEGETPTGLGALPIHEVGRNGDVFPQEAGKMLPVGGFINWGSMHIHSPGVPGADRYARMDVGFKLHPTGYKPKREFRGYTFGRTEIQVDPFGQNEREDAYFVAPQHMKLTNYEPHMHANGVRMCMQAAIGRAVITLNCSGYDHNWVRNYQYEENYEPLIPKGTILHAIGWFDNSPRNNNVIDPRNAATFGNGSQSNMFIMFNFAEFLTDEQYKEEIAKRKEFLALTGEENVACLACYLPVPKPRPANAAAPAAAPAATPAATAPAAAPAATPAAQAAPAPVTQQSRN
jgi:hypothetical protein